MKSLLVTTLGLAFTGLGLTIPGTAEAASLYNITNLGTINSSDTVSRGYEVSEQGNVVGTSGFFTTTPAQNQVFTPQGFLWTPTNGLQNVGTLGGVITFANNLNAANPVQVVGSSTRTGNFADPSRAFIWDSASPQDITDLFEGTPAGNAFFPSSPTITFTSVSGINNAGVIAGFGDFPDGQRRAFRFDNNNRGNINALTDLGVIPGTGDNFSRASRINNAGFLAGYSGVLNYSPPPFTSVEATSTREEAFLWNPTNQQMQGLGILAGGNRSRAFGLSENNDVVGVSEYSTGSTIGDQAFVWDSTNGLKGLGLFGTDVASRATDVNSNGLIVGSSCAISLSNDGTKICPSNASSRAVLWENVNGNYNVVDVNSLIPTNSGWRLLAANGVNDQGQIVGTGLFDADGDGTPEAERAFLLNAATPVPFEPSASLGLLMLAGFSGIGWLKRKLKKQQTT